MPATTIDHAEVDRFSALAAEWWNPAGKFKPLHKFNPVRLEYIRENVCNQFDRDVRAPDALKGLRVLDIGCGGGLLCEPVARMGADVQWQLDGAAAGLRDGSYSIAIRPYHVLPSASEKASVRLDGRVLVTELSRWGRSTQDLLDTLNQLAGWNVSVVALSGMTFELDSPHGRMMATMLAGIAQFERDLMSERIKSGLAAAKARGKKLGRQPGQRPKSDRLAPKVMALIAEGRSYRWIARDLGISKNAVLAIAKRAQPQPKE